eukprot:c5758_g1_i1.p1 GENE.c5758_g1_i1~~c5758_g1_i1.p1  ORF type:complete len:230 (-),score=52.54 c5758_g1_i1:123-758(-)
MGVFVFVLCFFVCFVPCTHSIRLRLNSKVVKCVSEDFPKNTRVNFEYDFEKLHNPSFNGIASVNSPRGEELVFEQGKPSQQLTFDTTSAGYYRFCFGSLDKNGEFLPDPGSIAARVSVKLFHAGDVMPRNVAEKEDVLVASMMIDAVMADSKDLLERLDELKASEATRRNVTENTNSRVLWLGIANVLVLVALAVWQSVALKKFLRKKKVI